MIITDEWEDKNSFCSNTISRISWVEEGAIGILQHLPLKTDRTIDYW